MSDIFRTLCQDITTARKFGIYEGIAEQKQRARVLEEDGEKWTAVVFNNPGKEIVFTALDNCIEFNKLNGRKESRCEGVLTWEDKIIFVEIKERSGGTKSWVEGAIEQLRNSIRIVSDKVNLDTFPYKRAYICNPNRGRLNTSNRTWAKKFQDETGYNLNVTNRIEID